MSKIKHWNGFSLRNTQIYTRTCIQLIDTYSLAIVVNDKSEWIDD